MAATPEAMASSALKIAKKELRSLMRKKLSNISQEALSSQSIIQFIFSSHYTNHGR